MSCAVLVFKRPSLCLFFVIVQAVARCRPRAFACLSKEVYPSANNASAIAWTGIVRCRGRGDLISFKYRTVSRRVLKLDRPTLRGPPDSDVFLLILLVQKLCCPRRRTLRVESNWACVIRHKRTDSTNRRHCNSHNEKFPKVSWNHVASKGNCSPLKMTYRREPQC
jgi:hypothetical protein